ncbi:MAG: serine/threonine-protein kinase, partial [Pseudomonadota bacterium]
MTGDNNETWQEIKKLFRECMSLDETNRVRRLEEIRQQDDSLYKEVCGLLEQAHQTSDEMQAAVDGLAGEINSQKDSEGKHIGQYKILRQIGEGGMGSVYLCKRDDEQFEKTVAVKILNLSRPSKHLVQRFRAERQILANLQHPYIAQLLDGGETDDGLPFIVMEYVDGTPIVQYCDENQLTIKSRLKLFAKVCEAIQHAHQNFVIHRDIKSNNILINQDGDPKLVDFGIAKLLETEGLNFTVAETMADARLLTPANASPEQVLGKKITTATDVYALGLLLYELLTGQAAYDLDEVSSKALERAICESQPTAPSKKLLHSSHDTFQYRSTTKDKLERTLSGDIDTIVLKALAKEPERRYSTALELVDDVHRYLSHQPVMAQPDSFGYRAGKFIQRNRAGLLTTGGVLALVIALVGFYTTRLTQERDRADMRATESEKTADFLISILNGANKIQHTEKMTVEQLLGFAAERIAPELQGQPEVQSRLHFVIGDAYGSLDEYDKALSHMEESVDYLRQADPSHENQVQLARVAILLSIYYRNDGEYQKSEDLSHEVLALHEKLFEPDDFRISYGLNKHGQILNAKGEYSEAKEYLERAVQVGLNGVGENNEFTADAMNNLAIVYRNLGDIEGSERYYRRA